MAIKDYFFYDKWRKREKTREVPPDPKAVAKNGDFFDTYLSRARMGMSEQMMKDSMELEYKKRKAEIYGTIFDWTGAYTANVTPEETTLSSKELNKAVNALKRAHDERPYGSSIPDAVTISSIYKTYYGNEEEKEPDKPSLKACTYHEENKAGYKDYCLRCEKENPVVEKPVIEDRAESYRTISINEWKVKTLPRNDIGI